MKKELRLSDFWIVVLMFILSRLIMTVLGVGLDMKPLYAYWQYLDIETLQHHLLRGVWYDHAQPPVFNLLLGFVLKIFGNASAVAFAVIFKIISLLNGLLLMGIVRKITRRRFLPLIIALVYLLSPATLVYECELFYTGFISLLLLLSVFFLIRMPAKPSWPVAAGIFLPLMLLCLTRSVYHILWLLVITVALLICFRKKPGFIPLFTTSILSLMLVGGWYVKNKIIFNKLSASTWVGMNMARNVFHDNEVTDSTKIEAYGPFSPISVYKKFIDAGYDKKFHGLNDRDLLEEMKNDSFTNENNVNYIPVSDLYQQAAMARIKSRPAAYVQNVLQSVILYFTPATLYSLALDRVEKIKFYDIVYAFNLTHFATGKQQRRIALTISAIPKLLIYLFVFFVLIRQSLQIGSISSWNLFILLTIGFVFGVSSLFEHYENMRFRFETEPLFLILAAQVISVYGQTFFKGR